LDRTFSKFERGVFWGTLSWSLGWWMIFLTGSAANWYFQFSDHTWSVFWWFKIWLSVILALALTFWFVWGGIKDLKNLIHDLGKLRARRAKPPLKEE